MHPTADGEEGGWRVGGQQWGGGKQRGGGQKWGGQQWGALQPLRTALQTISTSQQNGFGLKQSWKAQGAINAHWALPVYTVFEDEKSKASDEKSVKRKIA